MQIKKSELKELEAIFLEAKSILKICTHNPSLKENTEVALKWNDVKNLYTKSRHILNLYKAGKLG